MRKLPIAALLAVAAMVATSAVPAVLHAQSRGPVAGAADDFPHRTAKTWAPFLKALITRRFNTAQSIFKIHRTVETSLGTADAERILARFTKPDRLELNLVGGKILGNNIGILFFTVATEDGPVAFKIYYYGFGNDINISRLDMTDDWDDIEQLTTTVDLMSTPVSLSLGTPLEN